MDRRVKTALAAAGLGLLVYLAAAKLAPTPRAPMREGAPAPALRLTDVAGQSATLAQYRGRVVLLDFWATWCESCEVEVPDLKRLHERYRAKGLEILGASVDVGGRRTLLPFIAQHSIPWRVLVADSEVTRAYRVTGLPAKFLIDPDGALARRYDGPVDPRVLETEIRRLLKLPSGGDT